VCSYGCAVRARHVRVWRRRGRTAPHNTTGLRQMEALRTCTKAKRYAHQKRDKRKWLWTICQQRRRHDASTRCGCRPRHTLNSERKYLSVFIDDKHRKMVTDPSLRSLSNKRGFARYSSANNPHVTNGTDTHRRKTGQGSKRSKKMRILVTVRLLMTVRPSCERKMKEIVLLKYECYSYCFILLFESCDFVFHCVLVSLI
jgi:hypothetical protein